jgi:FkbM family methyltransferase
MKILMRKLRVALTPQTTLLKTKLSNGAIVYGKNRKGFGGLGIYIYRDAIEPEFEYLEKFLDSEGVFVDVGANTGIYTIKAAKHFNKNGTILALESFPDVLATLFQSIQSNGFTNVRLRNFCAGERTGSATLWMNQNQPNSFSLVKREEKASCLSTLTVALDDLFVWEGLNRLDYLKIDVEGAEKQVIAGAIKVIEKYRPIIQIEITFHDISINLLNYSVFRASEKSPNKIYIPNESKKNQIAQQLGWKQISN